MDLKQIQKLLKDAQQEILNTYKSNENFLNRLEYEFNLIIANTPINTDYPREKADLILLMTQINQLGTNPLYILKKILQFAEADLNDQTILKEYTDFFNSKELKLFLNFFEKSSYVSGKISQPQYEDPMPGDENYKHFKDLKLNTIYPYLNNLKVLLTQSLSLKEYAAQYILDHNLPYNNAATSQDSNDKTIPSHSKVRS